MVQFPLQQLLTAIVFIKKREKNLELLPDSISTLSTQNIPVLHDEFQLKWLFFFVKNLMF